jgi:hypothetical protein
VTRIGAARISRTPTSAEPVSPTSPRARLGGAILRANGHDDVLGWQAAVDDIA